MLEEVRLMKRVVECGERSEEACGILLEAR